MKDDLVNLTPDEIKRRLGPLFNESGLELVILFGSVAVGKVHGRSDIDLGFLYGHDVNILDLTGKVTGLLGTDKVDVVDLRRASPLLRFSAARNCVVLFERVPGTFSKFLSLAFRRFVDTKKLRNAQRSVIRDFLHERGLL